MSLKSFFTSRAFGLNLLAALALTLVLLAVILFSLKRYTDHGESFAVPDLRTLNEGQVRIKVRQNGLKYVIADSVYTKDAVPGTVIEQIPVPGFQVKKGRTIFLTVCAGKPEQVAMPRLTDISLRQAINAIHEAGLVLGEVEYVPSAYPDLVLEQKVLGIPVNRGEQVDKGSAVSLVVGSTGTGQKTVIPNLIGVAMEQVEKELAALFLAVGSVIYDETVITPEDSSAAWVWRQRPATSVYTRVDQGSPIDLWLTVAKEKEGFRQIQDTIPVQDSLDVQEPQPELLE
jgi:hypothetical protein